MVSVKFTKTLTVSANNKHFKHTNKTEFQIDDVIELKKSVAEHLESKGVVMHLKAKVEKPDDKPKATRKRKVRAKKDD